ncbi:MAG: hypothetical protein V3T72_10795 [Thermoanaerobaculia bacterium]
MSPATAHRLAVLLFLVFEPGGKHVMLIGPEPPPEGVETVG